ncbi:MAG: hypothetical protein ABSF44_05275 [Candidatus Bathyarchaeia archaeon]
MSDVTIATNPSVKTTTISFTVTGESGTTGFSNLTIPISAVSDGTTPTIYIDGLHASNQGFTQDANNYCIWYTTSFSTHQVTIQFAIPPTSKAASLEPSLAVGITVPEISLIFTVIAVRRLTRKPEDA